jgi:hypothetical protein
VCFIQHRWFFLLTRLLAIEEFVVVDLLTRDPERINGKRYGETDRFSDFMGRKKRKEKIIIST